MIPRKILKKIRRIEIRTNRLVCDTPRTFGMFLSLLILGSCATTPEPSAMIPAPQLPAEVAINKAAGRGGRQAPCTVPLVESSRRADRTLTTRRLDLEGRDGTDASPRPQFLARHGCGWPCGQPEQPSADASWCHPRLAWLHRKSGLGSSSRAS